MRVHDLKCWPGSFKALWSGQQLATIRRDDRGFEADDYIVLRAWDPYSTYTGDICALRITHVLRGADSAVPEGYALLSVVVAGGAALAEDYLLPTAAREGTLTQSQS